MIAVRSNSPFWANIRVGDFMRSFLVIVIAVLSIACAVGATRLESESAPLPVASDPSPAKSQTAVFAGGCFWGVEAVFEHVKGVIDVKSGYAGGTKEAGYDEVSTGSTGHAESVLVTF